MSVEQALELSRSAIMMALLLGSPILFTAVAIGLIISIMQAVTQIQDQTISFVPKIIAMILMLVYVMPWMVSEMVEYSTDLIQNIPSTF
jgi:flagellar biosynthesis protein FliQ